MSQFWSRDDHAKAPGLSLETLQPPRRERLGAAQHAPYLHTIKWRASKTTGLRVSRPTLPRILRYGVVSANGLSGPTQGQGPSPLHGMYIYTVAQSITVV